MIADFFTKPLQGTLFRKLRDVVMGYKHIDSLHESNGESSAKERVRNETKTKKEMVMAANNSPSVVKVKKDSKKMTWAEVVTGKSKVQKNGGNQDLSFF